MRTNFDNISFVNISKTGGSILKKKVMLAAAMLLMVGGLSACGPNKEKILQKTIDSQSKIKSGELDSNISVIAKADGYSRKILMDLDVTFTKDPSASKVETVISNVRRKKRLLEGSLLFGMVQTKRNKGRQAQPDIQGCNQYAIRVPQYDEG